MKNKNNTFLFTVKDYLTSDDSFNLYWDNQKKRAWTDLGETKDLNHYYSSDQYTPHQAESKSLINILYSLARRAMLRYKLKLFKSLVKPSGKLLDIGCGAGDFLSFMDKKNFDVYYILMACIGALTTARGSDSQDSYFIERQGSFSYSSTQLFKSRSAALRKQLGGV
jgi:hypothetical protein